MPNSGLTSVTSAESTNNVISGTSSSIETMDNEQSVPTSTVSQPSPLGGNIGYAVGGAVGGLMVVMVVAVGIIIFLLLVIKRGQKGSVKVEANGNGVQAFNNSLYDKGEETNRIQCMYTHTMPWYMLLMYNINYSVQ